MVSELGFVRILPLFPPPAVPTATWGIELTVSVSTVILLVEPSPGGFPLPVPVPNDFEAEGAWRTGGVGAVEVDLSLTSPFPPLSLPLSFEGRLGFALRVLTEAVSDASFSDIAFEGPFSAISSAPSIPILALGVFGLLISCTVSSVELAPLTPLAGVLIPVTGEVSSASLFDELCFPS